MKPEELLSIPAIAELAQRDQWVTWRYHDAKPKPKKIPYCVATGRQANYTDPADWCTFQEAIAASEKFDGIGFVFKRNPPIEPTTAKPLCGIDLDCCRDPESGALKQSARDWIEKLDSYTEVSPSGRGVKVWVHAHVPGDRHETPYDWDTDSPRPKLKGKSDEPQPEIALFDDGRYFTVTGAILEGAPTTIEDRQQQVDALWAHLFPPKKQRPDKPQDKPEDFTAGVLGDDAVLEHARLSGNRAKFNRLWSGDWSGYGSQSEGDLALLLLLAFWTRKDRAQMKRLFVQSGLCSKERVKAKPKFWDYLDRTIAEACERQVEVYQPRTSSSSRGRHSHSSRSNVPEEPSSSQQGSQQSTQQQKTTKPRVTPAKLPFDAEPAVVIESLNAALAKLDVVGFSTTLQVTKVYREEAGDIVAETNHGLVTWPTLRELTDYKLARIQIADDIGIVLPLDRALVRVVWNHAAALITRLAKQAKRSETVEAAMVRDALHTLWINASYPEARSTEEFIDFVKSGVTTAVSRDALNPPCVFIAEGACWFDRRVARAWNAAKGRDIPMREWMKGTGDLGFESSNQNRQCGALKLHVRLWRGPKDVLQRPVTTGTDTE